MQHQMTGFTQEINNLFNDINILSTLYDYWKISSFVVDNNMLFNFNFTTLSFEKHFINIKGKVLSCTYANNLLYIILQLRLYFIIAFIIKLFL